MTKIRKLYVFFLRPLLLTIQPKKKIPSRWVISNLWTGSLFGERVKKSRIEGMERVRACRQTLGTAIPPSCLVIADHLPSRSLCVTWIHWYVISFASKKGSVGNRQLLPRAKILLFPMSFFSGG